MATINNRSPYALAVAAREFSKIIDPESVGTVPDDVVAAWAKSEPGLSLLEQGLVSVQVEKAAPKSKSKKPSVKTLIGRVKSIDSVDELTAMYEAESSPRVLAAIEERIVEIGGGDQG